MTSQGRSDSFADDARRVSERHDGPHEQQRRQAYRVKMRLPVHIDDPVKLFCEVVDISVLGVRFDRELPCTPGVVIDFRLEIPMYGAAKPDEIELQAQVVRLALYSTGLRFVDLDPGTVRAVRELVNAQQRRVLAMLRESEGRRMAPGMLREDTTLT